MEAGLGSTKTVGVGNCSASVGWSLADRRMCCLWGAGSGINFES